MHNAWLLGILILVSWVFNIAHCSNRRCRNVCGKVKEVNNARRRIDQQHGARGKRHTDTQTIKNKTRIVNGYNPPPRGFMVMIRVYMDEEGETYATCGGSLINDRFVITAGHCVCVEDSVVTQCVDGQLGYDAQKLMKVYVGINKRDLRTITKGKSEFEYAIKRVIIHPNWKGSQEVVQRPDLALIELEKKVKWKWKGKTQQIPICLPENDYPMHGKEAYVSGWGRSIRQNCYTDNRGPSRNVRCRFPFSFMGNEYFSCETEFHPSELNRKCLQFRERRPRFKWKDTSYLEIRYNRGKKTTKCFPFDKKDNAYGWCGACLPTEDEYDEGGCPTDLYSSPLEDPEFQTKVEPGAKWGYCTKECHDMGGDDHVTNKLQETQLSILSIRDCGIFNSTFLSFSANDELCAGLKHEYPKYKVYDRKFVKKRRGKRVYKFVYKGSKRTKLDVLPEHAVLDYYIGYSDSCQGDSGGPLYQFIDGKAYLSGVLSRGNECGGMNQPGIYTMVREYLPWIQQITRQGKC